MQQFKSQCATVNKTCTFRFCKWLTLVFVLCFNSIAFGQTTIIPYNSTWSFYDQGDVGTTAWKDSIFNDTPWLSGAGELGYGDGDENTVIGFGGVSNDKHITSYFRKQINIASPSTINCELIVDDGAVVFLNGIEVFRENLPLGIINFSTLASNTLNENAIKSFSIPASLVISGINTFAVEVHQASSSSSDVSFDFEAILLPPPPNPGIYINEVLASNQDSQDDQIGNSSDWVEIYNGFPNSFDLLNHFITDDPLDLEKHQFTSSLVIPPGESIILWASGNTSIGNNHLPFALSSDGEYIALVGPNSSIIDSLSFPQQKTDVSYGRKTDGSDTLRFFSPPSFDDNNEPSHSYLGFLPTPNFSTEGGYYSSGFKVAINSSIAGSSIVYSVDGSTPEGSKIGGESFNYYNTYPGPTLNASFESLAYLDSIDIVDPSSQANVVSAKATTYDDYPSLTPTQPVRKAFVLKAIATKPGYIPSEPETHTYFIKPDLSDSIPVLSLSTNEDNLFDRFIGMYTAGWSFLQDFPLGASGFCRGGNFDGKGDFWERDASFQLYENGTEKLNQNIQFRIHGGCSRSNPRKSLRLYADNIFDHSIFPESPSLHPRRIVLRVGGSESDKTFIRDALFQDIIKDLDLATQKSQPAILFLNGEYWGIHNIRERVDRFHIEEYYNIEKDDLDLISVHNSRESDEGDDVAYSQLLAYLYANSLTSSTKFEYVSNLVDIDQYIDYQIVNFFSANADWVNNNTKFWRQRQVAGLDTSNKYTDGKWRHIVFDIEGGMNFWGDVNRNIFNSFNYTNDLTVLWLKLYENQEFKERFFTRFLDLLNATFKSSNTLIESQKWQNILDPYLAEHTDRWKAPASPVAWYQEVALVDSFFSQRPAIQRNLMKGEYGNPSINDLIVDVNDMQQGLVKVNTITINDDTKGLTSITYPWTGKYFSNLSVRLEAIPKLGYKFTHWLKNGVIFNTSHQIEVFINNQDTFKAEFEPDFISGNPFPVAKNLDRCGYTLTEWNSATATGVFPPNMAFVYMQDQDPDSLSSIADTTSGAYNLTSRTRINGLGNEGISFINTGNQAGNVGYPGRRLGGALLALNTTGYDSIFVSFLAGTINPGNREYNIKLQYREGDLLPFKDVLGANNQPIVYKRSSTTGDSIVFKSIALPAEIINKPYVQLFWRYYFTGVRNSTSGGARDQLRLDDIIISSKKTISYPVTTSTIIDNYNKLVLESMLGATQTMDVLASENILLKPGFETGNTAIFKAEVASCP